VNQRVGGLRVHVSDGHLGNEQDLRIIKRDKRLECLTEGLELAQITGQLAVLVALQKNMVLLRLANHSIRTYQVTKLRRLKYNGKLLPHEIRIIDIDEEGIGRRRRVANMALPGQYIVAAAKIDYDLLLRRGLLEEAADNDVYGLEPQPVTPVDEGCSPLGLLDEVAKVMRLVGIVKALDTALRDYAATICLGLNNRDQSGCWNKSRDHRGGSLTPMMRSSRA
jgi:hypothetical protein